VRLSSKEMGLIVGANVVLLSVIFVYTKIKGGG